MSGRMMLRLHYHPTDASMLPHIVLEAKKQDTKTWGGDKARHAVFVRLRPDHDGDLRTHDGGKDED